MLNAVPSDINTEPKTKKSKRRLWLILAAFVVVILVFTVYAWRQFRNDNPVLPPLTEEETELLGEWKFDTDGRTSKMDFGFTLLPEHKCIKRWYTLNTNDIIQENVDQLWWRNGNRLTIRSKYGAGRDLISIGKVSWSQSLPVDYFFDLTPDGPGRYKTNNAQEIKDLKVMLHGTGTGSMSRVIRTP